jgi:hypothetical protein
MSGDRIVSADDVLAHVERIIGLAAGQLQRDLCAGRSRGEHQLSDEDIDAIVDGCIEQMVGTAVPQALAVIASVTRGN